jgi:hypothetical protein
MNSNKLWAVGVVLALGAGLASAGPRVIVEGDIARGVYGRIIIGDKPPPPVVVAQPVIIAPPPQVIVVQGQPVPVPVQPVYIYAPPGHQKKWHKHCARYGACAQPVYFVKAAYPHHSKHHGRKHQHHDD